MTTNRPRKDASDTPGHVHTPASGRAGLRPVAGAMTEAITAGLRALDDLRAPDRAVTSGDLAHALRAQLLRHQHRALPSSGRDHLAAVVVAVRVACAHLDAENLIDARLALTHAHDALPTSDPHEVEVVADPGHSSSGEWATAAQAHLVSDAHERGISAHAAIQQAAGILAAHGDTSPAHALAALHRHAQRRRFVVSELARDIIAGRVEPETVVTTAAGAVTA